MPEATVLYLVTALVVLCLVMWVAFVLTTAKEPWARALPVPPPQIPPAPPVAEASTLTESDSATPSSTDPS